MPPLPPNVTKAGLVRSHGGWANSSLSRRSNTTRGLLSTRVPQSLGTTGGGIPNPSIGIGVTRLAMPRNAAGTWRPVSLAGTGLSRSYITYQGVRTYIQPVAGDITTAIMGAAYLAAGIIGNTDAHTLTFGTGAHTVGTGVDLGSQGATGVAFVGHRSGDLSVGANAFIVTGGTATSALATVTFPGSVGGALSIGDNAFQVIAGGTATSALATVTFPGSVGGALSIGDNAFQVNGIATTSALATVTFPGSVGGVLSVGANAFQVTGIAATPPLATVTFPGSMDGALSIGDYAFSVIGGGPVTSALATVTFPGSVGGALSIGDNAFQVNGDTATSVLATLTFPGTVGETLSIGANAFDVRAASGAAISELATVTFPGSVGGDLSVGANAFDVSGAPATSALATVTFPGSVVLALSVGSAAFAGNTFVGAAGSSKGVRFPTGIGGITTIGSFPFFSAGPTVRLGGSGSGAQLSVVTTGTVVTGQHYYI